jgi:hypothetical protein
MSAEYCEDSAKVSDASQVGLLEVGLGVPDFLGYLDDPIVVFAVDHNLLRRVILLQPIDWGALSGSV